MNRKLHLPPLLAEIASVERSLSAERRAEVPDFVAIKELRNRHQELVRWARNGWATPSNDPTRTPPAAPAARGV